MTEGSIPQWDMQDRLAKALRHARVSKEQVADYLGVNVNTINNYLAGRTRIPRGSLRLWAQLTGVDLTWLQDGLDPSTPPVEADKLPARPTGGTFIKRSVTAATEGTPQHEAQADS